MTEKILNTDPNNNGCNLWTISKGTGTPVILINGGPGCSDYLWGVSELIEDQCQVVRFEPRGCGRSDWDGNYDMDTMIADLDFVRASYGFERCILIGHSFGPDVGLAYTIKHREHVMALIGISGGRIVNDRDWSETYERNKKERDEVNPVAKFHADPQVNPVGNKSRKAYIKRAELLKDIAALDVPAMFIAGAEDIRPNWPIQQLAGLMGAKYVEIEAAAHCIWLTHGGELRDLLRNAIAEADYANE